MADLTLQQFQAAVNNAMQGNPRTTSSDFAQSANLPGGGVLFSPIPAFSASGEGDARSPFFTQGQAPTFIDLPGEGLRQTDPGTQGPDLAGQPGEQFDILNPNGTVSQVSPTPQEAQALAQWEGGFLNQGGVNPFGLGISEAIIAAASAGIGSGAAGFGPFAAGETAGVGAGTGAGLGGAVEAAGAGSASGLEAGGTIGLEGAASSGVGGTTGAGIASGVSDASSGVGATTGADIASGLSDTSLSGLTNGAVTDPGAASFSTVTGVSNPSSAGISSFPFESPPNPDAAFGAVQSGGGDMLQSDLTASGINASGDNAAEVSEVSNLLGTNSIADSSFLSGLGSFLKSNGGGILGLTAAGLSLGRQAATSSGAPPGSSNLGQVGNTEQQVGSSLVSQGASGNIPAGLQAGINHSLEQTLAAIRGKYASMGQSGSSGELADIAAARTNAVSQQAQIAQNIITQGTALLNDSSGTFGNLARLSLSSDQALSEAISNFGRAAGINAVNGQK